MRVDGSWRTGEYSEAHLPGSSGKIPNKPALSVERQVAARYVRVGLGYRREPTILS